MKKKKKKNESKIDEILLARGTKITGDVNSQRVLSNGKAEYLDGMLIHTRLI